MVSKLSFKGDKNKKKLKRSSEEDGGSVKKQKKQVSEDDLMMINNRLTDINTLDPAVFESGWSTANSIGDLNGPAIIMPLPKDEDGEDLSPLVLSITDNDEVELARDLDIDETPTNFNSYEDDSIYQQVEPKRSLQVLVLNSVLNLVGSKKEIQDHKLNKSEQIKISLKSKNNFNLTVCKDDLKCDSNVLTDNEIFQFIRVKDDKRIMWKIQAIGDKKLYLLSNGIFKLIKDDDDLLEQYFMIRVQIQNTVNAKKIKLLKSEK